MSLKVSKRYLITGWSWFLWKSLIEKLLTDFPNAEIWNLWRTHVPWTNFVEFKTLHDLSLDNLPVFDDIIHTLALSSPKYCWDFSFTDDINVWLTKRLATASQNGLSNRIIHLSSVVVYSNDNTPPISEDDQLNFFYNNYSFSKGIAEEYLNYFASKWLSVVTLRLSNVYWFWQKLDNSPFFITEKIIQAINNRKVEVLSWTSRRDWLYIDDAIEWIMSVLNHTWLTGTFNLWSWVWTLTSEIWIKIANYFNVPYSDLWLTPSWPIDFFSDISKLSIATWWKPKINLGEGLDITASQILSFYENRDSHPSADS